MNILFDKIDILLIITACLNLLLGAIIFLNGRKKKINIIYSLNIIAIIGWIVAMILYRSASQETNLFWCTILYISPTFIASSFLYFTYIFPSQKDKNISLKSLLIFSINGIIIAMVALPGLIIKEVNIRPGLEKEIIFTKFYWFYFLYTAEFFSYGFIRLFKKYRKSTGIERLQVLYLLSGYALAANLAFVTNLIMPWIGFFFLNWLGQIFTIIMVGFTAYTILKYRLMDIRIVIKRSLIFLFLVLIFTAIFVSGAVLVTRFLEEPFKGGFLVIGSAIISIIISLLFQPLKNYLQNVTDTFLFVKEYEPQKFLGEMGDLLAETLEPKKLHETILAKLESIFHYKKAAILLLDANAKQYRTVASWGELTGLVNNLVATSPLIKYLHQIRKVIVSEELLRQFSQTTNDSQLPPDLQAINDSGASVIVPLFSKQVLVGLMLLGEKKSGDIYTSEDINILEIVGNQAATSIINAQLYEEMRQFNVKLKEEVARATADLRKANQDLKKLDQAKSEFISIASHQLRTPLTIIKGYISMMLEGSFGKLTETERHSLDKVYASNERLIKLVDDLLNISRIESGRLEYNFELVDLDEIVYGLVEQFKPVAKKKKIYLDYIRPEKPLNKARVDLVKIKEVISNLIDNAIKYTKKGGIRIAVKEEKNQIEFSVVDTGEGMSQEEIKNLFKKFTRGKGKSLLHTEGSGLGLYVAHKLIEAHQGRIHGTSQGKSRGSRFWFTLPVVKK